MGIPRKGEDAKRNEDCKILEWRMSSYWNMLILLLFLGSSGANFIGKSCSRNSSCSSYLDNSLKCMDGICKCPPTIELKHSSYDLSPICDETFSALTGMFSNCKKKPSRCTENEECIDFKSPYHFLKDHGRCSCKEGHIRVGSDCLKVNHQKVLEPCYVIKDGPLRSCDLSAKSYCKQRKCICFETFFANTTSGSCEPMSQYIIKYNLTSYQVKPGEYCTENHHCISGLTCKDFKCNCPEECPYKEEEEICDCGLEPISEQGTDADIFGPVFVGIFLGILIIVFWCRRIRKTIEKRKKKLTGPRFDGLETVQDSPRRNTYSLTPINTNTGGNVAASPSRSVRPSSTTESRQSPLRPGVSSKSQPPKYDEKTPASDLPPYRPPVFGFSPSDPLESFRYQPPPPYTEKPLDASAPPYAFSPPTVEGSSLPEAGPSPSAPLPYDISPSVLPSTNPSSSLPCPSRPSSFSSVPDPSSCPPDTGSSLPYAVNPYGASSSIPIPDPLEYTVPPYNPSQP
ncbi:hypothetical protein SK128_020124 [Halocaridina rubra]|uniref:EB domain-containing protein n=1 Tax=Halocaridina rubra TaxID=373956 RepID=A0AAN9A666_HALRR